MTDPHSTPEPAPEHGEGHARPATLDTVEAVVRAQLSKALGGRRGMLEAAAPTLLFTLMFLTTKELRPALVVSVAAAIALLVVRLAEPSSPDPHPSSVRTWPPILPGCAWSFLA